MSNLTNDERETHLNLVASNRSVYTVFSDDPVMQRKLEKIGATVVKTDGEGIYYELEAKQVSLRKKRVLSEKQKAILSERMKRLQKDMRG